MTYQSNSERTKLLLGSLKLYKYLLILTILIVLVATVIAVNKSSVDTTSPAANFVIMITTFLLILGLFVTVMTAVNFIKWFRRAYFNYHAMNTTQPPKYSEAMALYAWLIPIVNFFRPLEIMKEMIVGFQQLNSDGQQENSQLIGLADKWWILFLGYSFAPPILNNMIKLLNLSGTVLQSAQILYSVVGILALNLVTQLVKSFSELHDRAVGENNL